MTEHQFGVDIWLRDDEARPPPRFFNLANDRISEMLDRDGLREVRRVEHERPLWGRRVFSIEVFAVDG